MQGTLTFRVKQPDFVQRVSKKFQPHGFGPAGGENIQNIPAHGHFTGAPHHGHTAVAPLHGLLQHHVRQKLHALLHGQLAAAEKMQRHIAHKQIFRRHQQAAAACPLQTAEQRHLPRPVRLRAGGQAAGRKIQHRAFPQRLFQRHIRSGHGRGKKTEQPACSGMLLTAGGQHHSRAACCRPAAGQRAACGQTGPPDTHLPARQGKKIMSSVHAISRKKGGHTAAR